MLTNEAIDLLERTKAYIREEPKRFDISWWGKRDSETKGIDDNPPCGTTCCIAGIMYLLSNPELFEDADDDTFNHLIHNSSKYASSILDCEDSTEHSLFYLENWPYDIRVKYEAASLEEKAEIACEMIDRYIAEDMGDDEDMGDTNAQD